MKLRLLIQILMIFSAITACTKSDNSEFTDSPIVESYLKPGDHPKIKITRQTPFSSTVNYSTSIMNGYGIFTALNSDTLYLTVTK